ncbi:hypothetical protein CRUP_014671 [Coryphaenoides rupestris]|nr:hypothetical protein CRUP_014671 [Coryphaenoides rupestris]
MFVVQDRRRRSGVIKYPVVPAERQLAGQGFPWQGRDHHLRPEEQQHRNGTHIATCCKVGVKTLPSEWRRKEEEEEEEESGEAELTPRFVEK